ncbi:MAG: site-2 protease family protein [Thermoplasmata archaeon]
MKDAGYIPVVTRNREGGSELVISVIRRRKAKPFGLWVNLVLLVATLISTIYVGEQLYVGYFGITGSSWLLYLDGFVYFALPLLIILGSHELGHFFVARRNGVSASLPFFIPAPFTILGTLGAFISLRDPLPDRKTLIKIGAAGPIVGFVMSIAIGVIGAYLGHVQKPVQVTSSQVSYLISLPLIYLIIPQLHTANVHPVAFAAWVGFLVTAINLFPIGQLDGGHVARGLLGENSKFLSYAFIIILILLGIYYVSWILFAIIVIILGLSHPPPLNDISKPGRKELLVGIVAIALVAISFSPVPFVEHIAPNEVAVQLEGGNYYAIYNSSQYSYDNFTVLVNNMNNYSIPLSILVRAPASLQYSPSYNGVVNPLERKQFNLSLWPSEGAQGGRYNFTIKVTASTKTFTFDRNVTIVTLDRNLTVENATSLLLAPNALNIHEQVSSVKIMNNGPDALLEICQFNSSSRFIVNSTSGFESSGNASFINIPSGSEVFVNITFLDPGHSGGIVLLDTNNLWNAVAVFYIPPSPVTGGAT